MTVIPHRLLGNKSCELPHKCIWFDTETDVFSLGPKKTGQRLRFGWACHQYTQRGHEWSKPSWFRFTTSEQFISWVESLLYPKTRTYLFAHNLHFETPVLNLFELMFKRGWRQTRTIVESPPFILGWRRETTTLEFLDTGNWWLHSAAKIGESIGVPKLPMPSSDASKEEWDTYCRRDVEVIRQAILRWFDFIQRYDLGGFARTLAGQSFRAYRHRFMEHEIFIDDHREASALSREAYHGGRTECFFIGRYEKPVHCYDVNSMYPYVMLTEEYPCKKVTFTRLLTVKEMERWLADYALVARVTLETDSPQYAHIINGKICFPVGRFTTALTTPDLKAALEQGHIKAVQAIAIYEKAPLFRSFVTELYRLRMEAKEQGDEVMTYNLKTLLNSLYGKFGQAGRIWKTVERTDDLSLKVWQEIDVETGTLYSWRQFGGVIQVKEKEPESFNSFPAIAAHVTAYARRKLWDLFHTADRSNVLYCDTDSLYVGLDGVSRLESHIHSERLGSLKLEKRHPWIEIHGLKDYETPGNRVCKGVKKSARWISSDTVIQEEWRKLPGLMREGSLNSPIIIEKTKHLKRVYDKGIVTPSGWVKPLTLTDD